MVDRLAAVGVILVLLALAVVLVGIVAFHRMSVRVHAALRPRLAVGGIVRSRRIFSEPEGPERFIPARKG